jgi:hypothetical protein
MSKRKRVYIYIALMLYPMIMPFILVGLFNTSLIVTALVNAATSTTLCLIVLNHPKFLQ